MILGFKQQFEMPIKKGIKIHTIRHDKPNRWKPGMLIHFAKGVRTKNYINFQMGQCFSMQKIEIKYFLHGLGENVTVSIDGRKLQQSEVETLARNDGFDSFVDFFNWFNQDFEGKIIHWTDFRY